MFEKNQILREEIILSLESINSNYFFIPDLDVYSRKIIENGKSLVKRDENGKLISFILFYDNNPTIYVSMIWTNSLFQNQGEAKRLILKLIQSTDKEIELRVQENNPAKYLYRNLKFEIIKKENNNLLMRYHRRVAIMQPYFFPYIGYFHLIQASEKIVFLDDVNFKKRGWINRNKIHLNNQEYLFTIPLKKASQNKLIKDIEPILDSTFKENFFKQLHYGYCNAPYYQEVKNLLHSILAHEFSSISELNIRSITEVNNYLGMRLNWTLSSNIPSLSHKFEKSERLIQITKNLGYHSYINLKGGEELYSKEYFKERSVDLKFIHSEFTSYNQNKDSFTPGLSIIDVLMFNDRRSVLEMLSCYSLL